MKVVVFGECHNKLFIWTSFVPWTSEGDADIYVSQTNLSPTYDLDNFDLYSATCGVDVVTIPESFKRPLGLGIYGHYAHETSVYHLEVYQNFGGGEERGDVADGNGSFEESYGDARETKKDRLRRVIRLSAVKTGLWALFETLELIFLWTFFLIYLFAFKLLYQMRS